MSVIKRSDLITDEAFKWPEEYAKDLEKLITTSKQLGTGTTKKNMSELEKVQRQLSVATDRSTKEFIDQKAALNTLNTQTRNAVKDVQNLDNAYDKLSKELNDTRKAYKNLAAQGKENTAAAKAQLAQIKRLDGQLKRIDNSVGQNQRSVGKYTDALKGVTARFIGWGVAIALVTKALSSGFKAVRDNSKANAELRGILNKTRKETIELRKEQLRLGGATVFTATQVTKAQTELSRLGLSMEEIITLTPAILDGAIALGVDMAEAAELVAGQLNAFGLAATEGKRVTDVLVRSTQISAFNFQRLSTALAIVSPAAKASNATLEDTVSILTAAVDANIDASTAATGLRNIYIDLADKGLTWQDAMDKINGAQNKLTAANDLFGKRGAVVSTVIAENTLKINENKIALDNATGAAKEFAEAQRDNLSGDQLLWTSAWEGFFQQLNEGNSFISEFTRGTIQAFTAAMQAMTRAMAGTDLETILWEENLVAADLSLEELGKVANKSADEIAGFQKILDTSEDRPRLLRATDDLADAQKRRTFILDLLKKKIKELNPVVVEDTDNTEDNTDAVEDNNKANESRFIVLKKLKSLTADLPDEFSKLQLGLFAITDQLFGKNTIDKDAEDFLTKTGDTIKKAGELSKEGKKKDLEDEKERQDRKNEIISEGLNASAEIFSNFTNLRIEQISQEIEANEFARNRELEAAGDNERSKFEINKKFDEERKKLQRKQAITEKANSLFSIAIGTAQSIIKTGATLGYPAAIPFVALAGAIGAIQAAAVIATPIPAFDEGKDRTPKDYIAGEKRPELRKSKGKWSLVDKPTLFKDSPGDTIVSGKETDSILGSISDLSGNNLLTDQNSLLSLLNNEVKYEKRKSENLAFILTKNNADLIRTIKNKKEVSIKVKNADVREKSGNTIINRLDYYYSR